MSNPVFQFAHRFDQVSGSAIREIFKVIAQPGMISFAGGNPAPEALPDDVVREISGEVMKEKGKVLLQYGATEGYTPFVESLKGYVKFLQCCRLPDPHRLWIFFARHLSIPVTVFLWKIRLFLAICSV